MTRFQRQFKSPIPDKAWFGSLLLLISWGPLLAETIHVSPEGREGNAGTAKAPVRTITSAAQRLEPGDVCVIHRGVYREKVRPAKSGTSDRPIVFRAADGESVLLAGTEKISNWRKHRNGVWRVRLDRSTDRVLVDGEMMVRARHPNAGNGHYDLNTFKMTADGTNITAPQLQQEAGAWAGATLWGMDAHEWVAGTAEIASSVPGTLELSNKVPFWGDGNGRGFVSGVRAAFDQEGEWFYEAPWLYLRPPGGKNPATLNVEVTRRRWGIDLSGRSYICVKGIQFRAASVNLDNAHHNEIDRCRFRLPSFRRDIRGGFNRDDGMDIDSGGLGVVLGGHHNTIQNSILAYGVGDGISVYGKNNRVENCIVHDFNLSASDCAPINVTGTDHEIRHNTVYNAGRSGILHRHLKNAKITHNHIYNVGLLTSDLGGTYCFQTDGNDTVIAYNRIHDVNCDTGTGIYIDNMSSNFTIHHNLVYNVRDAGIRLNTPVHQVRLYHNTLVKNGSAIDYWGQGGNKDMDGVVIVNNILNDSVRLGDGVRSHHNYREKDPRFKAPEEQDFHLSSSSPCIDAGVPIEGIEQAIKGSAPDIGCFEHGGEPWPAGARLAKQGPDQGEAP